MYACVVVCFNVYIGRDLTLHLYTHTWIQHHNETLQVYIYIHNSYLIVLVLPVQLLRPTFPPCSSKSRVQEIDKSSRDRLVHTRQDRWRNFQDPIIQGLDSTSVGADGWISKWLRFTLEILEKVAPSLGALSLSIWYLCIYAYIWRYEIILVWVE